MPQYRVVETSFVNNQLKEAGSIVDYDPPIVEGEDGELSETTVSSNLELIEEAKPAKASKAKTDDAALA